MAQLTQEQNGAVAGWFAAGASLDEIQKRIQNEFGVHLTYLDVRLMVAELPQPVEPEPMEKEIPAGAAGAPREDGMADDMPGEFPGVEPPAPEDRDGGAMPDERPLPGMEGEMPPAGELEVAVDPLAPPGCIACGSVTFSDGNVGKWMLDQMGRLGLSGLPQGYRPTPEDSAQFQPKLVAALRARGLM